MTEFNTTHMQISHYYQNIQGWFDYEWLIDRAISAANDGDTLIEIGGWKGKSACYAGVEIINSGKMLRYRIIDHFNGNTVHRDPASKSYQPKFLTDPDFVFNEFIRNTSPLAGVVSYDRRDSGVAFSDYRDSPFVFIDGEHTEEGVKSDIWKWRPAVRDGGILAGHDWKMPPVRKAVIDCLGESNITSVGNIWIFRAS